MKVFHSHTLKKICLKGSWQPTLPSSFPAQLGKLSCRANVPANPLWKWCASLARWLTPRILAHGSLRQDHHRFDALAPLHSELKARLGYVRLEQNRTLQSDSSKINAIASLPLFFCPTPNPRFIFLSCEGTVRSRWVESALGTFEYIFCMRWELWVELCCLKFID